MLVRKLKKFIDNVNSTKFERVVKMGGWRIWDGEYEKVFYDVMLQDGEVITNCYPNAGIMQETKDCKRAFTSNDYIFVRRAIKPPYTVSDDID